MMLQKFRSEFLNLMNYQHVLFNHSNINEFSHNLLPNHVCRCLAIGLVSALLGL